MRKARLGLWYSLPLSAEKKLSKCTLLSSNFGRRFRSKQKRANARSTRGLGRHPLEVETHCSNQARVMQPQRVDSRLEYQDNSPDTIGGSRDAQSIMHWWATVVVFSSVRIVVRTLGFHPRNWSSILQPMIQNVKFCHLPSFSGWATS